MGSNELVVTLIHYDQYKHILRLNPKNYKEGIKDYLKIKNQIYEKRFNKKIK